MDELHPPCSLPRGACATLIVDPTLTLSFPPSRSTCLLGTLSPFSNELLSRLTSHTLDSSLCYNGHLAHGPAFHHTDLKKVTSLCYAHDTQFLTLTVRETLQFCFSCGPLSSYPCPCAGCGALQVSALLSSLHLTSCADTPIAKLSGGELRRLGVAEALCRRGLINCYEEPTTGLDSSTASSILTFVLALNRTETQGVVVCSVKQPEALLLLFDDALVVRGDDVLFHGPVTSLEDFFQLGGFPCPTTSPLSDHAELLCCTCSEGEIAGLATAGRALMEQLRVGTLSSPPPPPPLPPIPSHPALNPGPILSVVQQLHILFHLHSTLLWRNKRVLFMKLVSTTIMALIIMTLFTAIQPTNYASRFGLALFSVTFFSFQNQAEVGNTFATLPLLDRHAREGRLFGLLQWWVCSFLSTLPITFLSALIFSSIVYWPLGWSPYFDRYLFFWGVLVVTDLCLKGLFILCAFVGPPPVAICATLLLISFLLLFSGVYVIRGIAPVWMQWLYFTSPFWYAVCAISNNEFLSPTYTPTQALSFMAAYDFPLSFTWQWLSFLFLLGVTLLLFFLIIPLLSIYAVYPTHWKARKSQPHGALPTALLPPPALSSPHPSHTSTLPPPSYPVTLSWESVCISLGGRNILSNVQGILRPGEFMGILGGSGSGKTTLLRCLALRIGGATGSITINGGLPLTPDLAQELVSFQEQVDSHFLNVTVGESLAFVLHISAFRWGSAAPSKDFLPGILSQFGLAHVRDVLVGQLSKGERKKLSFCVALASGPHPVCLGDEVTSNLDGVEAFDVVKCLRGLSIKGYAVAITLHQPSVNIWHIFSHITLLGAHGRVVYSGAREGCVGAMAELYHTPLPMEDSASFNPATWVLELISSAPQGSTSPLSHPPSPTGVGEEPPPPLPPTLVLLSPTSPTYPTSPLPLTPPPPPFTKGRVPHCTILGALIWRAIVDTARGEVRLLQALTLITQAVLLGLLTLYIAPTTFQNTQSTLGLLLGGLILGPAALLGAGVATWYSRKAALKRELASGFFPPFTLALSISVADFPLCFILMALFGFILYPIAGVYRGAANLFFFFLALVIMCGFFLTLTHLYLFLAPNAEVSQILCGLALTINVIFAGVFIPQPQIPPGWIGLYYAVPLSHILKALAVAQFWCAGPPYVDCPEITVFLPDGSPQAVTQFLYILKYLGITSVEGQFLFSEMGWASLGVVVVMVLGWIAAIVWGRQTQY